MQRKMIFVLLSAVCAGACAAGLAGCSLFQSSTSDVISEGIKFELTNENTYCATGFAEAGDTRESLVIPEKVNGVAVTEVAGLAFEGSTSLKNVSVPASVTYIEVGAFKGCTAIESMTLPFVGGKKEGWALAYNFSEDANALNAEVVPATLKSVTLLCETGLTGNDFKDCTALESVTLPDTLTYVGRFVFENCTSLKSVVIPDSVTNIEYAFTGCTALESLTLPHIGQYRDTSEATGTPRTNFGFVFSGTSLNDSVPESLKTVTVTAATELDRECFKNCTGIENIILPESLADIGESAFCGCTSLKSVNIPVKITEIGLGVFLGCENLEITLPSTVTSIGREAFENCTNLKITLSEGLLSIGYEAFANCENLEISIPDSVTSVDTGAFSGCTNAINQIGDLYYVDSWLISATGETADIKEGTVGVATNAIANTVKVITIPESLVCFSAYAFYNARSLSVYYNGDIESWCNITFANGSANPLSCANDIKVLYGSDYVSALTIYEGYDGTLEIPDGVAQINDYVFAYYTALKAVYIPHSVTAISENAFYGCNNLNDIIYDGTRAEWEEIADLNGNYTVHCTDDAE